LSTPLKINGSSKVETIEVAKVELGKPDSSGRSSPNVLVNDTYRLKADIVIKALGFDPEPLPQLFNCENLQVTRWGTIKIDHKTMMTNLPGVFAAGDIVRGASLVVWAIKDGRDVAKYIDSYLSKLNKKEVSSKSFAYK